jgi:uncharacterized protein YabN with tetrapyrrole methylase and pyrophosphatase domain
VRHKYVCPLRKVCVSDQPQQSADPLCEAREIQVAAARVGFDWPRIEPVFDKLLEEIDEIQDALHEGKGQRARCELGDLLFTAVNLARFLGADPGAELSATNRRFQERFDKVKQALEQVGRKLQDCSLEELDEVWQQVKAAE